MWSHAAPRGASLPLDPNRRAKYARSAVLTKPKILTVPIMWLRVEEPQNGHKRYVMNAATYQRLIEAVR